MGGDTTGQLGQPGGLPALTAPSSAFTDDGKVLKVALAGGVSRGPEVISLEEISVTKVQAARLAPRAELVAPHSLRWPWLPPCRLCRKTLATLREVLTSLLGAPTCPGQQKSTKGCQQDWSHLAAPHRVPERA